MKLISSHKCHGGEVRYYTHQSRRNNCDMAFTIFLPPHSEGDQLPFLTFLSGRGCTPENFTTKANAFAKASDLGMAIIVPDTSPRGDDVPDHEWLGKGSSYYLDAKLDPWTTHYQMESYIALELQALVVNNFPLDPMRQGIFGHSMGGYGALTLHYKYPYHYKSVSAFAPVSSLIDTERGQDILAHYIGQDHRNEWPRHDPCYLVKEADDDVLSRPILIDMGASDPILDPKTHPVLFEKAAKEAGQNVIARYQAGYDHGYFFVQSFINDHLDHHAKILL